MMQQTTPQPGQAGGPGSIRRAATTAPPVIRTRQEAPIVSPRPPSTFLRTLESLQNYVLSEETLILVELLVVVAVGVIVFVNVLHPAETFVNSVGQLISSLGINKLLGGK
jgi:hypothetical protein